jgi:tRNA A37 threonylcarbamoyladenosine modification protein TsaB
MNTAEKNMFYELVNPLEANATVLRATLNLALDHSKTLVPFIRNALKHNEEKMERAYKLIDKRYD